MITMMEYLELSWFGGILRRDLPFEKAVAHELMSLAAAPGRKQESLDRAASKSASAHGEETHERDKTRQEVRLKTAAAAKQETERESGNRN